MVYQRVERHRNKRQSHQESGFFQRAVVRSVPQEAEQATQENGNKVS